MRTLTVAILIIAGLANLGGLAVIVIKGGRDWWKRRRRQKALLIRADKMQRWGFAPYEKSAQQKKL